MYSTEYRLKENQTGTLEPVSAWLMPHFQRFAAITLGTTLLLSLVAAMNMKSDVDVANKQCAPYIQDRADAIFK